MKKRNLVSLILVLLIVNCFVISACAAHVTDDARLFSDQERAYLESGRLKSAKNTISAFTL